MLTPAAPAEALQLLQALGAPPRLLRHHEFVAEAADALLRELSKAFLLRLDSRTVLVGAALHDAGKIRFPEELSGPGNAHEQGGEGILLDAGVAPEIARICRTHARWSDSDARLEDLLVAAADHLWRGMRTEELERRLVEAIVDASEFSRWEVFAAADEIFSSVAEGGEDRLLRSLA